MSIKVIFSGKFVNISVANSEKNFRMSSLKEKKKVRYFFRDFQSKLSRLISQKFLSPFYKMLTEVKDSELMLTSF